MFVWNKKTGMKIHSTICCIALLCLLNAGAQTINRNKPSDPSLIKGKGSFSCKINGQLYRSAAGQAKCWTSSTVTIALLWAKGDQLDVSCQIQHIDGTGSYLIKADSSGTVNFTIGNRVYWIRRTGQNYLRITLTGIREVHNIKLLSGTFEGVLEDKNGNRIQITEGRFTTEDV